MALVAAVNLEQAGVSCFYEVNPVKSHSLVESSLVFWTIGRIGVVLTWIAFLIDDHEKNEKPGEIAEI